MKISAKKKKENKIRKCSEVFKIINSARTKKKNNRKKESTEKKKANEKGQKREKEKEKEKEIFPGLLFMLRSKVGDV